MENNLNDLIHDDAVSLARPRQVISKEQPRELIKTKVEELKQTEKQSRIDRYAKYQDSKNYYQAPVVDS